jgi:putative Mn2+ efflux pump MntP
MLPHLLSSFFLSSACNVDNFAVSIAYGAKRLRIDLLSNLLIALVSALGTILSMSVGAVISRYLPDPVANLLGSGVLIAIGLMEIGDTLERERKRNRQKVRQVKMLRSMVATGATSYYSEGAVLAREQSMDRAVSDVKQLSYETFLENPERADKDRSGHIDVKESIALAFGLTINNLGSGVGAGISGLSIALTAILTFIFSVASVISGYILGDRLNARMTGVWTGVLSGLMVVCVGIYEYFTP